MAGETEKLLVERNATEQTNFINSIDMDVPEIIQPTLNDLYSSHYGSFWSYVVFGVPIANILAAITIFIFIIVLKRFFTRVLMEFLLYLTRKTATKWDEQIVIGLREPIGFAFVVVAAHLFFMLLFVQSDFIHLILESLIIYTIFWAILALLDTFKDYIFNYKHVDKEHSKELASFFLKVFKSIIIAIGISVVLNNWGVNVTGIVASLGLGGLVFALAAKDTASNLFASITLLLENSIRSGEWIKVSGIEGTVESVGMRSTKIRSFEKSLYTVPNFIIANNPIENFSRRGVRRIKMTVGLTYNTTSSQIEHIVQEIRDMLQHHPKINQKESLLVNFTAFGDSTLDIFIYAFTDTAVWGDYLDIREDIHLKIIKIVEKYGCSFAFPSQSVYVENAHSILPEHTKKD